MSGNSKSAAAMAGSMAFFTFNDALMKALSDQVPFYQALFLRGVGVSVLLMVLALFLRGLRFDLPRHDWGLIVLRTVAEIGAAYFFVTALFNAPIANVTAILQALPLTVSLAGALFLGEAIGWRRLTAIAFGFFGVLLIVKPGAAGFDVYSLYALAAVASVTVRDLAARRLSAGVPSLTVALIAAAAVTVFAAFGMAWETWVTPPPLALAQLGGAVVFILGAYVFSVTAMRSGDIGTVAPLRYTGLLWALVLGFLIFGDWPDGWTLLGSAIVVASGLFTLLRERALGRRATQPGLRVR